MAWHCFQLPRQFEHLSPEARLEYVVSEFRAAYGEPVLVLCQAECVADIAGVTVRTAEAGEPVSHHSSVYFVRGEG